MAASATSPSSMAAPTTASKRARACASLSLSDSSSKANQGESALAPSNGRRCCGNSRVTACRQSAAISSKPVSEAPKPPRARDSTSTAASMLSSASKAVQVATGKGNSLSVAAVMMPSVPSLPTYRSRKS